MIKEHPPERKKETKKNTTISLQIPFRPHFCDGFKRLLLEYGSQQSIAVNKYHVYISIRTQLRCTSITSCWFAIWKLNKLGSKRKGFNFVLTKRSHTSWDLWQAVPQPQQAASAHGQSRATREGTSHNHGSLAAPTCPLQVPFPTAALAQRATWKHVSEKPQNHRIDLVGRDL